MRIIPTISKKEPTYQVVLDALALSPLYPTFLITTEVPKIYMQQFWSTITKIKDSSLYQFKLDKKKCRVDVEVKLAHFQGTRRQRDMNPLSLKVITDHMHQPWRTFVAVITDAFLEKLQVLIRLDFQEHKSCGGSCKETAKKPAARRQSAGVQIGDTHGVPCQTQLEKAIKRSKQETNIHHAGGSSEGAGLEPEVPDEQKGKSIDTSEGTG
ncbi:hypothetical protein Tco_0034127 [Tanacetum coccineum]